MFQPNLVQAERSWFLLTTAAEEKLCIFFIRAGAKFLCFCGCLLPFSLWAWRRACPGAIAGSARALRLGLILSEKSGIPSLVKAM